MNDKSTLRDDAGCFFVASWKKRYFLQEKVLKKRNKALETLKKWYYNQIVTLKKRNKAN